MSHLTSTKDCFPYHHQTLKCAHKGALLKLPFFTLDTKKEFSAILYLTFHSWSPFFFLKNTIKNGHRKL